MCICLFRKTFVILDKHGRIIVVFVARPNDPTWMDAIRGVARAILHLRTELERLGLVKAKDCDHRRGKFLALASGISFGGGQKVCVACSLDYQKY